MPLDCIWRFMRFVEFRCIVPIAVIRLNVENAGFNLQDGINFCFVRLYYCDCARVQWDAFAIFWEYTAYEVVDKWVPKRTSTARFSYMPDHTGTQMCSMQVWRGITPSSVLPCLVSAHIVDRFACLIWAIHFRLTNHLLIKLGSASVSRRNRT